MGIGRLHEVKRTGDFLAEMEEERREEVTPPAAGERSEEKDSLRPPDNGEYQVIHGKLYEVIDGIPTPAMSRRELKAWLKEWSDAFVQMAEKKGGKSLAAKVRAAFRDGPGKSYDQPSILRRFRTITTVLDPVDEQPPPRTRRIRRSSDKRPNAASPDPKDPATSASARHPRAASDSRIAQDDKLSVANDPLDLYIRTFHDAESGRFLRREALKHQTTGQNGPFVNAKRMEMARQTVARKMLKHFWREEGEERSRWLSERPRNGQLTRILRDGDRTLCVSVDVRDKRIVSAVAVERSRFAGVRSNVHDEPTSIRPRRARILSIAPGTP